MRQPNLRILRVSLQIALFAFLAGEAFSQVTQYVWPVITSVGALNKSTGSGGDTLVAPMTVSIGTKGSVFGSVTYSGPGRVDADFNATSVSVKISATNIIGTYQLQEITFIDEGFTVYKRNGTIQRLFYTSTGLPSTHSLDFSKLDFAVVAPPATPAPTFTTQPVNIRVNIGQSAAFTVAVSSTAPATLQWRKNGSAIAGATSATFSISSVTTTDGGSYIAVATNSGGSTTSAAATLTVDLPVTPAAPSITGQPVNIRVTVGQPASFTASFTSSIPATVQWRKNATAIIGATNATLNLSNVAMTDAGSYDAVITNPTGATTSSPGVLTVDAGRVKNISVRIVVPDNGLLIAGFVLDTSKTVLIRGIGRSLEQFGVAAGSTMPNPSIEVFSSMGTVVAQNDDYAASATLTESICASCSSVAQAASYSRRYRNLPRCPRKRRFRCRQTVEISSSLQTKRTARPPGAPYRTVITRPLELTTTETSFAELQKIVEPPLPADYVLVAIASPTTDGIMPRFCIRPSRESQALRFAI